MLPQMNYAESLQDVKANVHLLVVAVVLQDALLVAKQAALVIAKATVIRDVMMNVTIHAMEVAMTPALVIVAENVLAIVKIHVKEVVKQLAIPHVIRVVDL